jgi:spore coat protein U-like protein
MKQTERDADASCCACVLRKHALRVGLSLWLSIAAANSIAATCTVTTPGLAFGNYDVFAAGATNGTGTLSIKCSKVAGDPNNVNISYTISLATGSSGSYVQRQMKSGTNTLGYNLYTTTTHSVVWGNGTGSTSTVAGSMRLTNASPSITNTHTVFGQIPPLQDVAVASNYLDNITVTVTY